MAKTNSASQKEIGIANSSEECFLNVRQTHPEANGMTWVQVGSQKCWAVIDATFLRINGCKEEMTCETCIFGGK